MKIEKPSYTTSKQALWISSAFAWAILIALTIGAVMGSDQAVALANIAFPSLVVLIASMLGIHRAFGSVDMRAITRTARNEPSTPPYDPRAQPDDDAGEIR